MLCVPVHGTGIMPKCGPWACQDGWEKERDGHCPGLDAHSGRREADQATLVFNYEGYDLD